MTKKDEINKKIENILQSGGIRFISNEEVQTKEYQLWLKASHLLASNEADTKAQEAMDLLEDALRAVKPSNERLRAQCLETASMAASYLGNIDKAVEYGEEALIILDRIGPPIIAAMARDHLARVFKDIGKEEDAKRLWKEANVDMDNAFNTLRSFDVEANSKKWWQFWK